MADAEADFLMKFQDGKRVSSRLQARKSIEPTQDTQHADEEADEVPELPSITKPDRLNPKKRQSEPPTGTPDQQLPDPTIDEGGPRKRRRLSVGSKPISPNPVTRSTTTSASLNLQIRETPQQEAPCTRSKTTPAPSVPEVQETPQQEGPRTRSKTTPAPSNPEVPETPPEKAARNLGTPESTVAHDGDAVNDDQVAPLSESRSDHITASPASTTTLGREENQKTAKGGDLFKRPAESNADGVTASVPPGRKDSPQPSVPETAVSEPMERDDGLPHDDLSRRVLNSPPVSPLSTPPSSPTLNAQALSVDMVTPENIGDPVSGPSAAVKTADKRDDNSNFDFVTSADSVSPAGGNGDGDGISRISASQQDGAIATPLPRAPSQLPTPPSSNFSDAGAADKFEMLKGQGRIRKPVKRYGDIVETPLTPEELEDEANPDAMDVEFEPSPSKELETPVKSKGSNARRQAAKKPIPTKTKREVEEKTGVTQRGRINLVSTGSPAPKSAVKRGPGRPKKTQTTASVTPEVPKKLTTVTATLAAPQGRKNATAKADTVVQLPKTPKAPKAPSKKNRMNQPSISLVDFDYVAKIKVDQNKLALSQRLSHRQPLESKPEPHSQPAVWAESRQALCETLPYFKKPQGGCYSNEGHVYGFLFDGVGHCREYLDENLILCRAGGSMEADTANGGMAQKKDQAMTESQVQSVINDMKLRNPLIVICGNRNVAAPTKMPHQYNVLGWYKPVFVWAEKTQGKGNKVWTTIKYRLERLNQHLEPAWHSPKDNTPSISEEDRAVAGPLVTASCGYCKASSPQIYLQGWMCLTPSCGAFWQLNNGDAPFGKDGLDYDPAFLLHRHDLWKNEDEVAEAIPGDVKPAVPKVGDIIGDNLFYVNTRGVCCPECGRCNSRRKFSGWKCENPSCGWSFSPVHRPVLPTMLHTPWDAAPTLVRNRHADGVHIESSHILGYKVSKYTFDGIKGCFLHIAASKELVGEELGANDMFAELQTKDMGLERRVFAVTKMSGANGERGKDIQPGTPATKEDAANHEENADEAAEEFAAGDLMTAFSMNYGMPYKFVASGGSQSFEGAPWPVSECRRRLNWAQKTFLTEQSEYMDFNEQLIFAYLEGQKIEYHDDGESGLGPRIATLSLGGRAKMHMRMKAKHYVGCSKVGVFTEERPVPGSIDGEAMYKRRLEKWEELQTIRNDSTAYNKRRKELPKELGIFDKKTKKAQDLVTVTLNHGDIIIMDGYDIQKYLEHKVVPEGYLRFALTCRTVLPDHLKPEELPSYRVEEDLVKYEGPKPSQLSINTDAAEVTADT